jgi:hypothetical protein
MNSVCRYTSNKHEIDRTNGHVSICISIAWYPGGRWFWVILDGVGVLVRAVLEVC